MRDGFRPGGLCPDGGKDAAAKGAIPQTNGTPVFPECRFCSGRPFVSSYCVGLLCRPFVSAFCVGRPFFLWFERSDETFRIGKRIIFIENFAGTNFHSIFAVPKRRFRRRHAEIAQLVERNLAKVEVAGPSPVFRSNNKGRTDLVLPLLLMQTCPGLVRATSRHPFQGPGVSTTDRGYYLRAARVRVPFSAPERQKKGESQDSPFCFSGGAGFDTRDLKAPLSGAGGVHNESRPLLARSASASPVFRSKKGKSRRILPFCFVCAAAGSRVGREGADSAESAPFARSGSPVWMPVRCSPVAGCRFFALLTC